LTGNNTVLALADAVPFNNQPEEFERDFPHFEIELPGILV
jgi:hypothetical protein